MEYIFSHVEQFSYLGVFTLLVAAGFGLPTPEDIILIAAGYLIYTYPSEVNIHLMWMVAMAGVMIGDCTIFWIGRKSSRLTERLLHKHHARIERINQLYDRHGLKIAFFGRFAAFVRMAVFFTAGNRRMPFLKFFLADFSAALLSVPTIIYIGYWFGGHIDRGIELVKRGEYIMFGLIGLLLVAMLLYKRILKRIFEGPQTKG